MNKKVLGGACSAVCMLVCTCGAFAQDEKAATETAPAATPAARTPAMPAPEFRRVGTLQVIKENGQVKALRLVQTAFDLVVDDNTKGMENLDGKRVRIVGTFSHQTDGKRMIAVKSFEAPEEEKPAAKQ